MTMLHSGRTAMLQEWVESSAETQIKPQYASCAKCTGEAQGRPSASPSPGPCTSCRRRWLGRRRARLWNLVPGAQARPCRLDRRPGRLPPATPDYAERDIPVPIVRVGQQRRRLELANAPPLRAPIPYGHARVGRGLRRSPAGRDRAERPPGGTSRPPMAMTSGGPSYIVPEGRCAVARRQAAITSLARGLTTSPSGCGIGTGTRGGRAT
jgi:hypothetical protein